MVATLHHNSIPRTSNFYESSFRQLSDVQQKQTGLLIGAVVADAAARPLEGCTAEEITTFIADRGKMHEDDEDPSVFASCVPRCQSSGPLRHHSYTCLFLLKLLSVMASARGEFPVSYVKEQWVSIARAHPECFEDEHASLLHVFGSVVPLPAIYPWADDATLRAYAASFVEFLTEPPVGHVAAASSVAHGYTCSALGVVLRCLQSNPDPFRNAAFMAVSGTSDIFPNDLMSLCPTKRSKELHSAEVDVTTQGEVAVGTIAPAAAAALQAGSCTLSSFPRRPVPQDVPVLQESLVLARQARSFAGGVKAAIRLGGPICQRSLIVGALIGARMGVRHIPPSWLSATHAYSPLVTMALEVAQWSWNPPRR